MTDNRITTDATMPATALVTVACAVAGLVIVLLAALA